MNAINPFAMASLKGNPDTLTLSEACKQEDFGTFVEAMEKEVINYKKEEHWEIIPADSMKLDKNGRRHKAIMAVWAFKRKQNPFEKITKYKVILNVHGGQTTEGQH